MLCTNCLTIIVNFVVIICIFQLLAGARVGDTDNHHRAALHMAAEGDFPTILSVLLEHGADADLMDESGNNGRYHVTIT